MIKNKIYDIIILGAGPAGLFCANKIDEGKSVLILDKSSHPAQKLLLSAKGRGNITNIMINPERDYTTDDSDFVKSAFEKYGVKNFLKFLDEEGIEVKEENNGRILLKSGKVKQFHEKLLQLVENKGVKIRYNSDFLSARKINNIFEVKTSNGIYQSKNFIVATGGPSFPKLGATGIAIDIARSFGLETTSYYPALVGFETKQDFSSLSGSSVIGDLSIIKGNNTFYSENGPILFTHWGISGPAIFNASLFMKESPTMVKYKIKLRISSKEITKRLLLFLGFHVNKLDEYIISSDITNVRGLDEAKVCGGGVKTKNLNHNFECKDIPGLYFIGECVDVTGKTGGFNLQRCRTSGAISADGINIKKE